MLALLAALADRERARCRVLYGRLRGQCEEVSAGLQVRLRRLRPELDLRVVRGHVEIAPGVFRNHTWNELGEAVIDASADQFNRDPDGDIRFAPLLVGTYATMPRHHRQYDVARGR